MKRKIEVTATDIKKGEPVAVYTCPIGRAINRTLRIKSVYVADLIEYSKGGKNFVANLPARVEKFIDRFDAGKSVKPFSFTLESIEQK